MSLFQLQNRIVICNMIVMLGLTQVPHIPMHFCRSSLSLAPLVSLRGTADFQISGSLDVIGTEAFSGNLLVI